MCSAHRTHIICTVDLSAMERCVSMHLVIEDFWLVGSPRHCWEDLVVDHLPVVDYWLGSKVGCFWLSLVGYWVLASWGGFVLQTPIPME